jgi:GTPase Era involved in 16S rRNA processing
MNTD